MEKDLTPRQIVLMVILGLLGLIILIGSWTIVGTGSRGVVTHFGRVTGEVLGEGISLKLPIITSVKKISVQIQKSQDDSDAASKDMQRVKATLAINWHINPDTVNKLYQTIGNEDDVHSRIIAPAVSEVLKSATAKMTAEEILTKRLMLKKDIDDMLLERLSKYSVIVDDISLVNLSFTDEFDKAVEAKQIAEQNSKKAQYIADMAKKEAEATVNKAQGQAQAQNLVRQSITPELLKLKAIEKWDGKLPVYSGTGVTPFVNVKE